VTVIALVLYLVLVVVGFGSLSTVELACDVPTLHNLAVSAAWTVPAVGISFYLARRDPAVFRRCLIGASLALFAVGFLLVRRWQTWAFQAGCVLVLVGCLVHLFLEWRRGPVRGSAALFDAVATGRVYEMDGIHIALDAVGSVPAAGLARVAVGLQNCWSGPRKVRLELEANGGPPLRWPVKVTQRLAGGEAGVLHLFAPIPADHLGRYTLLVEVGVSGWGGRRVVARRGEPFENKVRGPEMGLFFLMGWLRWGGGLRLELSILRSTGVEGVPPEPRWVRLEPGVVARSWRLDISCPLFGASAVLIATRNS
jgi:hypothetical protein